MKLPVITKRDVKAFFLGILFMLLLDIIFDWEGVKREFKEGYNSVKGESVK